DGDAVFAPVVGEAHGELANSAAACAIGSKARVARNTGDRADVNDAAIARRNHAARGGLRNEKTSAQICVQNRIPIFPGNFECGFADVSASIVDENVEMAKSGFGVGDHLVDAVLIAPVELEMNCEAAEWPGFVVAGGETCARM